MRSVVSLTITLLTTLAIATPAEAAQDEKLNGKLYYSTFRVTKRDGTLLWQYATYDFYESVSDSVVQALSFMDNTEPLAMLHPVRESKTIVLKELGITLASAKSLSVPLEGFTRVVRTEPDGRRVIKMENHYSNWWTSSGESTTDDAGNTVSDLTLRNKAGDVMLTYRMTARPATNDELKAFKEKRKIARTFNAEPGAELEYTLKRSKTSYPHFTPQAP